MAIEIIFPDPNEAEDDGLIAVGGSLSVEFLLAAYRQGVFPWFNLGEPILWWSPNPRMVLFPEKFNCSDSLMQILKSQKFRVSVDTCFERVIRACSDIERKDQSGTWLTDEMINAYIELHHQGFAHSVEVFANDELAGGLYGVSIGKAFFGESMFHYQSNASKVALYHLAEIAKKMQFHFIDVQQSTSHLKSLGAEDIPRYEFLERLKNAIVQPSYTKKWEIGD